MAKTKKKPWYKSMTKVGGTLLGVAWALTDPAAAPLLGAVPVLVPFVPVIKLAGFVLGANGVRNAIAEQAAAE